MNVIPDPKKCLELLKENGCSDDVVRHCKAVCKLAVKIARRAHADVKLVEAGALLHDIGRSRTHIIHHAVEGARIAEELGLPASLVKIIERHIGAGIPKDEAVKLGLPAKDYMPETLEEKIVAHADNLIDGEKKQMIENQVEKALEKGQKTYAARLMKLHNELSRICNVNPNDL